MSTPILDAMSASLNLPSGEGATPPPDGGAQPAAAAAQSTPEPKVEGPKDPAKPAYLNPYAKRAAKVKAPSPAVAAPANAAAPVAEDPRIAKLTSEVSDLMSVISRQAQSELSAQPETVRVYLAKVAGESPAKQLEALNDLRSSGLLNSLPSIPKGATTAPAVASPKPGVGPANPDAVILAEYESLKGSPILQAAYRNLHGAALARARGNN